MKIYKSLLFKELKLLRHDLHGLAVIFVMPMLFLLIMSLALPSDQEISERQMQLGLINTGQDSQQLPLLQSFIQNDSLLKINYFSNRQQINSAIKNHELDAGLMFQGEIQTLLDGNKKQQKGSIKILLSPGLDKTRLLQLKQYLNSIFARVKLHEFMLDLEYLSTDDPVDKRIDYINSLTRNNSVKFEVLSDQQNPVPNAIQQSFPSWLIFGMFFIVMPLSNTLIRERDSSTLMRLKAMGISSHEILTGKFLPYFIVNFFQFVLLFATALYLVPLAGGQQLVLYGHWGLYALLLLCISFAALGFGLFIATIAKTSEHAIVLGGGLNLIMAALGGIMIPKHVMSDSMQFFTQFSPMSWAQNAFFELLVYQNGWNHLYPNLIIIMIFGLLCFSASLIIFKNKYLELTWS